MIGDKTKFVKLELKDKGFVTYGDNKGRTLGNRIISNGSSFNIKNVFLVEWLKHNLISISQPCHKGFKVVFEPSHCLIFDACGSIVLIGIELKICTCFICIMHHIT